MVITAAVLVVGCKGGGASKADDGGEADKEDSAVDAADDGPVDCGRLSSSDDPDGVLVALDGNAGKTVVIEVLDPLSPESAAFEKRWAGSPQAGKLHRKALVLPLEGSCNWMVETSTHPGACAISEAVLCAPQTGVSPNEVLAFAFEHREEITAAAEQNPEAAAQRVRGQFEGLRECVGSPEVRARLTNALRWAVKRKLPVTVPQVYVDGVQLCDPGRNGLDRALETLVGG